MAVSTASVFAAGALTRRFQAEMGISADARLEVWRPPGEPYPMRPLPVFRQGEIIAKGFERRGLRVAPAPLAINSIAFRGRAACLYDGWCDAGCPTGALANPLVTHYPQAVAAGARFITDATVTAIITDRRGRADSVDYRSTGGGVARRVYAHLVVLAASTVQSVRLLLNSRRLRGPPGLANSSGLVGRRFRCHTIANVYGLFDEPLANHFGVTAGQQISQDGYRKNSRARGFGSYQ